MNIPNGATFEYVATWPNTRGYGFGSGSDAVAIVSSETSAMGLPFQSGGPTGAASWFAPITGGSFDVDLIFQNQTGRDLDSDTALGMINTAVQDQLSGPASPSSIIKINSVATGAAGGAISKPGATHVCGDPTWGFFDDPGLYIQCMTSKGLSSLGLVFVGLAVGVVLLVTAQEKHKAGL